MSVPKVKNTYYNSITGNVIIIGKNNSGKTALTQRWASEGCFNLLKKIYWISGIPISDEQRFNIDQCFKQNVHFITVDNLTSLDNTLKQIKNDVLLNNTDTDTDIDENKYEKNDYESDEKIIKLGEESTNKYLVIFDDVSELADKCLHYIQFLTTCRKGGFSTISIFHLAYHNKNNWQMIKSQADIIVLCNSGESNPAIDKILINNSVRNDNGSHISARSLWLRRLYNDLISQDSKAHLLIDKRNNSSKGPARYRSNTGRLKQLCYYPDPLDNKKYLIFNSIRIDNSTPALYKITSLRVVGLNGQIKDVPATDILCKLNNNKFTELSIENNGSDYGGSSDERKNKDRERERKRSSIRKSRTHRRIKSA